MRIESDVSPFPSTTAHFPPLASPLMTLIQLDKPEIHNPKSGKKKQSNPHENSKIKFSQKLIIEKS